MIEILHLTKRYKGVEVDLGRRTWIASYGISLWLKNLLRALRLSSSQSPPVLALNDITLSVEEGEIFGLLGPNGAGKTTLIKILSGLLKPTSGTARIDGLDILANREEVKRRVAYISTTGWMGLEWPLTVEESLLFYCRLYGAARRTSRDRIEGALQTVGLASDRHKVTSQLSHGMRQKLVLARGLLVRTPVVFLDEPTVGLDPVNARQIRDLIKNKLSAELHQTVILTTHNIQEVEEICDRVGILHQGKLIAVGAKEELRRQIGDRIVTDLRVRNYAPVLGQELHNLPGVLGVSSTLQKEAGGAAMLRIHLQRGKGKADDILRCLKANNVEISFIGQADPNLEDVFLHLTGAGLR